MRKSKMKVNGAPSLHYFHGQC